MCIRDSSYSVGQVFQETVIAGNNSIIQGVQQPFEITTLGVDNFASITVEMKVYPNPTSSILFLNFADFAKRSSSYELFDTSGKMIRNAKIQSKESQIDLQQSPSGIYILKVSAENVVLKTFKTVSYTHLDVYKRQLPMLLLQMSLPISEFIFSL